MIALLRKIIQNRTWVGATSRAAESQDGEIDANVPGIGQASSVWRDTAFLWALAFFSLVLHLVTASRYEFYVDELYGIVSSRHSLAGCAETFPMQLWLMRLATSTLGTTQFAVRFFPAVAGSANILAAGLLARELGGRRFAISLAGLGVLVAPIPLFAAGLADAWSYDGLLWSLSALVVARILQTGNGRLWWLAGMVWGLGLLNKPTMLLFMMGVGLGLLLTRARVELLRKGYWLAVASAFVLSSPVWVWQSVHGWPLFDAIDAMSSDEYADLGFWLGYFSRDRMLLAQPAFLGPLNLVLAVFGVFYGLGFCRETAYRVLLWACVAAALAFVVTSGHPSYMSPLYALLVASGCVAAARITEGKGVHWMRPVLAAGLAVQGLLVIPLCVPILPKDLLSGYARYSCRGVLAPLSSTVEILAGKNQGEMVAKTFDRACAGLSASDRKSCVIIVGWCHVAILTEFHGAKYGLPEVFSPHLNYALWGPPREDAGPVLASFFNRKELEGWFDSVEYLGRFEGGPTPGIFLCRSPKRPYSKIWQEMCNKDGAFRWKVEQFTGNGEDPTLPTVP